MRSISEMTSNITLPGQEIVINTAIMEFCGDTFEAINGLIPLIVILMASPTSNTHTVELCSL